MEITIKCSCGNCVAISAMDKKATKLRDSLERRNFWIKKSDNKETLIQCAMCKRWVALEVD